MLRLISVFTLMFCCLCASAQMSASQQLAEEARKELTTDSSYTMVWMFPTEYWALSYGEKATMSEAEIQQVIDWLSPYTLALVADGSIAPLGNVVYNTKSELRKQVILLSGSGDDYRPLEDAEINEKTRSFLAVMKPVLAGMLGHEPKNIHLFLFPASGKNSKPIVASTQRGRFAMVVENREFVWRTPFAALMPPKRCPIDGEELNGGWEFCPWHGVELMKSK